MAQENDFQRGFPPWQDRKSRHRGFFDEVPPETSAVLLIFTMTRGRGGGIMTWYVTMLDCTLKTAYEKIVNTIILGGE